MLTNQINNYISKHSMIINLCLQNNYIKLIELINNKYIEDENFETIIMTNNYNLYCHIISLISKLHNKYIFNSTSNFNKINNINYKLIKDGIYVHNELLDENTINDILKNCNGKKYTDFYGNMCQIDDIYNTGIGRFQILNQADILKIPQIQNLVTDSFILNICQDYLGTIPILSQANFWITNGDGNYNDGTMIFHQDYDDIKFLKVFIYLNDVTDLNGPHCYVKGAINNIITPPNYKPSDRLSDNYLELVYGKENMLTINGNKGTIIFENTHGFHKGKPIISGYRFMLQLQYVGSANFFRCINPIKLEKNNDTSVIYEFKEKYPLSSILFYK